MLLPIPRLTACVALALGELPDPAEAGWTIIGGCTLRELVATDIEDHARTAVMDLPLSECTDLKDLRTIIRQNTDWGELPPYRCQLPDDFLRLHSLRMPDWPYALSEEFPGDPQRRALGDVAPGWLADRPSRPMLRIIRRDSGVTELCFGPTRESVPSEGAYVPVPVYDADEGILRDFQPLALRGLVEKIANLIKSAEN